MLWSDASGSLRRVGHHDNGVAGDTRVIDAAILDAEGIAAATVAADSARIGDGQSTLTQGVISAVSETAHRLGARVGEAALNVARHVAENA